MSSFAVRPRPVEGESFKGFVLRVASANVRATVNDVFSALEIPYSKKALIVGESKYEDFILALANYLKIPVNVLLDSFEEVSHCKPLVSNLTTLEVCNVRLCPHCVKEENPILKEEWRHPHLTHCSVHGCELVDSCPVCAEPLDWNSSIFDGCRHCETSWSNIPMEPTFSKPEYLKLIDNLEVRSRTRFLQGLYAMAGCITNPYRIVKLSHQKQTLTVQSSIQLFHDANVLLSNTHERQRFVDDVWREGCKSHQHFTCDVLPKFIEHPILKVPELTFVEKVDKTVPASSLNRGNTETLTLDELQLLHITGLKRDDNSDLVHSNLVQSNLNNGLKSFDLLSLDNFMARLNDYVENFDHTTCEGEKVTIAKLCKFLPYFATNSGSAIHQLMDMKIPLWKDSAECCLADFYLSKKDLSKLLNNLRPIARPLSLKELKGVLCNDKTKVSKMAELFSWKEGTRQTGYISYELDCVRKFLNKYCVLERWCKMHFYPKVEVFKYLDSVGINSINDEYISAHSIYVYEFTEELRLALLDFEDHWLAKKSPVDVRYRLDKFKPLFYSNKIKQFLKHTEYQLAS